MISSEQAARVACSFIASYYKTFVNDLPSLIDMYGDNSSSSFARYGEAVATTSQGKLEVRQYLDRLHSELGARKVQIRNADFVPTADGSIAVTVSGQLFTRRLRQVFSHTFVLSQTKYQNENTLFIAGDSLRFISHEPEVIPVDAIIVKPGEELAADAAAATDARPPRERKERVPREKKPVEEKPVSAVPAAIDASPAREEKPPRVRKEARKPRDEAAPSAPSTAVPAAVKPAPAAAMAAAPKEADARPPRERKERAPREGKKADVAAPVSSSEAPSKPADVTEKIRKLTSKVLLSNVPRVVKLSEVRAAVAAHGKVVDSFWSGDDSEHAVVVFSSPEEASSMVHDRKFTLDGKKIRLSFFF